MRRSLSIVVSAMILAGQLGSPVVAAVPTTAQLSQISGYLANNDVSALRAFLLGHPELLEEATPLAALLREFMDQSDPALSAFDHGPDLRDALENITREERTTPVSVPEDTLY